MNYVWKYFDHSGINVNTRTVLIFTDMVVCVTSRSRRSTLHLQWVPDFRASAVGENGLQGGVRLIRKVVLTRFRPALPLFELLRP